MKNNKIPRKFSRIVGRMRIDTSMSKASDIIHISKTDNGYLAFNTRTEKYATVFVSMIRNSEVFELINIE